MMTKEDFMVAYAIASVTSTAGNRALLKPSDIVKDANDLYDEIVGFLADPGASEEKANNAAEMQKKRSKGKITPST